ncbi:MAG TPA: histone deacetylase [Candidatus Avacidaminococcus intestinavium]|uniref:Histone deacetylase n=1 Tax=Candidatus Avacidaminococcus intestinavium TaxID=2840684 RepID=A0A9D1SL74_9FIRM|nr:histone deacetylase [Candidatus Avacidaminococcus intestinavium]
MINQTHPERPERLLYTRDQIMEEGLFDVPEIREYRPVLAEIADLQRVHIGVPTIAKLITPAHLVSAGGCLAAADAVMQGEVKRAFALVRPPGHHAMRVVHGIRGFCVVNIEAIMVAYLRAKYGVRKIAVVDTDVHHGDGSEDIFYHDPDTLFISFHQDGRTLYPGTGFPKQAGSPAAMGMNINLPLLPGTGDEGIHRLFDGLIKPILDDFEPELIINSAGQDNHFSDPLASMQFTAQGYAQLADKLKADIAVLEGGYSVESALPYINTGIILAMAELPYGKVKEPDLMQVAEQRKECNARVDELISTISTLWKNRKNLSEAALAKCGASWSRHKDIYYDEEGISESQIETAHYCKDCKGFLTIATKAEQTRFGSQSAFIVSHDESLCAKCKTQIFDEALKAKKQGLWQYVFVQNRLSGIIETV